MLWNGKFVNVVYKSEATKLPRLLASYCDQPRRKSYEIKKGESEIMNHWARKAAYYLSLLLRYYLQAVRLRLCQWDLVEPSGG